MLYTACEFKFQKEVILTEKIEEKDHGNQENFKVPMQEFFYD
jgi:hypothetical protein